MQIALSLRLDDAPNSPPFIKCLAGPSINSSLCKLQKHLLCSLNPMRTRRSAKANHKRCSVDGRRLIATRWWKKLAGLTWNWKWRRKHWHSVRHWWHWWKSTRWKWHHVWITHVWRWSLAIVTIAIIASAAVLVMVTSKVPLLAASRTPWSWSWSWSVVIPWLIV